MRYEGLTREEVLQCLNLGREMRNTKTAQLGLAREVGSAASGVGGSLLRLLSLGKSLGIVSAVIPGITLGLSAHAIETLAKRRHKDEDKVRQITEMYEDATRKLENRSNTW